MNNYASLKIMVELTVLIDDLPNNSGLELDFEHGLSLLIEYGGNRILCDTGLSGKFMDNAEKIGVNLWDIDFAFISHGHNDHIGGLSKFLKRNDSCPVYLSQHIPGKYFYSYRQKVKRGIGVDNNIFLEHPDRFRYIENSLWISEGVALIVNDTDKFPKPLGNKYLTIEDSSGERPDKFEHEISLALVTPNGLVVVSSCSHCGVLNIIGSSLKFTGCKKLAAFIGGTHFIDGTDEENGETNDFIGSFVKSYPGASIYTGHCTGNSAKERLRKKEGIGKIDFFSSGQKFFITV